MPNNYGKDGREVILAADILNEYPELTVVYDIGANKGDWSNGLKQSVNHELELYLFDPIEKYESLRRKYGVNFNVVLSDCEKEVDWYDREGNGQGLGASYYKEMTKQYEHVQPIKKQATTLDLLIEQNALPTPHLIKLDTQGSELDILRGASKLIESVDYILLEVVKDEFSYTRNVGAPGHDECIEFMKNIGYIVHSTNLDEKPDRADYDILFKKETRN